MLCLSEKIKRVPLSATRKLVSYANNARSAGKHVYNLNIGQPDILTPNTILNAYKSLDLGTIEYGNSLGLESYRKSL